MDPKHKLVESILMRYKNKVKECRLRALIDKQEDLARLTGINRSTINALEKNRLFLSSAYALLLAEKLNCKLDDLFEKVNQEKTI